VEHARGDGRPLRGWGARTTIEGARLQQFWNGGAVAGWVEQFAENAPTTYATVHLRRLGAFSSWDAARAAVEKHVPFMDGTEEPTEGAEHVGKEDRPEGGAAAGDAGGSGGKGAEGGQAAVQADGEVPAT